MLYTEVLQAFVLVIGSFFITFIGLNLIGGWDELKLVLGENKEQFKLWRPIVQEGIPWWKNNDFPWLGIMIASPVVGIWYWCTDQYIVQRTLAANSLKDARRECTLGRILENLAGLYFLNSWINWLCPTPKGLMIIPSKADGIDGDQVFPTMVSSLLPIGLRGLVVAGLLSALMSSLASLFNSCATLFTLDIYSKLKPNQSDKHYVTVGRVATAIVVICGIIWIPIMKGLAGGGIYKYLQQVQGYLAPPITAVFLLGLFWRKTNSTGAFVGLISGFILGFSKLLVEAYVSFSSIETGFLKDLADFNFLYYSGILFLVSVIIMILTSIKTASIDQPQTEIEVDS